MFKGSTAHCINEALPKLIQMDALIIPSTLTLDVPTIPKPMMEKGIWYVENSVNYIYPFKVRELDEIHFYFLRKDNNLGVKKITKKLVDMYGIAISNSMHVYYLLYLRVLTRVFARIRVSYPGT